MTSESSWTSGAGASFTLFTTGEFLCEVCFSGRDSINDLHVSRTKSNSSDVSMHFCLDKYYSSTGFNWWYKSKTVSVMWSAPSFFCMATACSTILLIKTSIALAKWYLSDGCMYGKNSVHIRNGVAVASFPTSSSVCIIFLMRAYWENIWIRMWQRWGVSVYYRKTGNILSCHFENSAPGWWS